MTTLNELWGTLEKKYQTNDAGMKRFVVAKLLHYKMVYNKTLGSQVQEFLLVLHNDLIK